MDVSRLLAELNRRGVRLEVVGDKLIARTPKGSLTPELQAEIREHKPELHAALAGDGERAEVLAMATSAGWPRLRIQPWMAVMAGQENWTRFTGSALPADLQSAKMALAEYFGAQGGDRGSGGTRDLQGWH